MTTEWVYKQSGESVWTVGHYAPGGEFVRESDCDNREAAIERCAHLNGGEAEVDEPEPEPEPEDSPVAALLKLAEVFGDLVREELLTKHELSRAESGLKEAEAMELEHAFALGLIDGKNAEQRAVQATRVLVTSPEVAEARDAVDKATTKLAKVVGVRTTSESAVSLMRAFLYSRARIGE